MPLVSEIDSARWYASPYFPADVLVDLFKHGKGTREWVVDNPYSELYVRYQTARTGAELRKLFVKLGPGKLHCGPRYAVDIADRRMKRSDFVAIEREFIVDVDLSDYQYDADSVEDCARAWPLVVCALQSIGLVLEEHFGFEHLVYVHSGRRGGHVWVLDAAARELTDEERSAIVAWCTPHGPVQPGGRRYFHWATDHPNFAALTKLAEDCFYTHCLPARDAGGLGMLDDPDDRAAFLQMVASDCEVANANDWEGAMRTQDTGADALIWLRAAIRRLGRKTAWLLPRLREAILTKVWMKLDENVSKARNHTLKVFFSVHPKTGFVSLPIPKDELRSFDPRTLPTVGALFDEEPAAVMAVKAATRHIAALARALDAAEAETKEQVQQRRFAATLAGVAAAAAAAAPELSDKAAGKRPAQARPTTPPAKRARIDLTDPKVGTLDCGLPSCAGCDRVVLVLTRRLRAYSREADMGTRVRLVLDQMPATPDAPLRLVPKHTHVPFPPDDEFPWAVHERQIEVALRAAASMPGTAFVAAEKTVFVALTGCHTLAQGAEKYKRMRQALLRRCMTLFEIPTADLRRWGDDVARLKCQVLMSEALVQEAPASR